MTDKDLIVLLRCYQLADEWDKELCEPIQEIADKYKALYLLVEELIGRDYTGQDIDNDFILRAKELL